jgi:hypothetical protein
MCVCTQVSCSVVSNWLLCDFCGRVYCDILSIIFNSSILLFLRHQTMDKVQKHSSFNTNTPSSESYRNYLKVMLLHTPGNVKNCDSVIGKYEGVFKSFRTEHLEREHSHFVCKKYTKWKGNTDVLPSSLFVPCFIHETTKRIPITLSNCGSASNVVGWNTFRFILVQYGNTLHETPQIFISFLKNALTYKTKI